MSRVTTQAPIPGLPKRAMIMAAGKGTRMAPLTDKIPKPLVQVGGKALIDHILDRLCAAGVEEAVVNVHYRADQMEAHLKSRTRPRIIISDERDQLLDSGGGIVKALPHLGDEPFLNHNADCLWLDGVRPALSLLARGWDDARMDALMLVASLVNATGFDGLGDFHMDQEGRLTRRQEKRLAPFVWTGVQIIHPRAFKDCPSGPFSTNLVWNRAIEAGRLYGVRLDGLWMHVGTPDGVIAAEAALDQV